MPTYDYRCEQCGHDLELFQSITEAPKKKCPACKGLRLKRIIGAGAGIIFKGSGFYETDYRSASYKQGAEKDKAAESDKGSGKDKAAESDKGGGKDKASEKSKGRDKSSKEAVDSKATTPKQDQ